MAHAARVRHPRSSGHRKLDTRAAPPPAIGRPRNSWERLGERGSPAAATNCGSANGSYEQSLAPHAPLFFSRKHGADGSLKAISRVQAWTIVKAASERADVRVLALRVSHHGRVGEPAPAHPHLFRHARVRQIVRSTRNLPLAQRQAGWSRLQMAYLTVGDDEARRLMQGVAE